MPTISIIVPVYNVEKYLNRCVDSIMNQTYYEYELILVDDGSTDRSGLICDKYAKQYENVYVLHNSNKGAAASRNAGLNIAKGRYVLFCDADDWYDTKVLDEFLKIALDVITNYELLCFDFRDVWQGNIYSKSKYNNSETHFSSLYDKIEFLSSSKSHNIMGYSIWNKLYVRKIIEQQNIRFFERDNLNHKDDWAEDLLFNLQYLLHVDNIKVLELPVYMLRKHGDINEQNEDALLNRFTHMMKFFNEIKIKTSGDFIHQNFWKIVIWHMYKYIYTDLSKKNIKTLRKEYIKDDFWVMFLECIELALDNWGEYSKNRWNKLVSKEYKNILKYLKDGNYTLYKLKNYFIWKIYCKICRM